MEPYRTLAYRLLDALLQDLGDRLVSLAIFGSVARGEARHDSDLDVLVICEGLPESRMDRIGLFMMSERKLDGLLDQLYEQGYWIVISPIILTPEEAIRAPAVFLDMTEDAVILYDREYFLGKLLERLRDRLREMGAERVWLGRRWYWRLWSGTGVRRVRIVG
ncbi:MAG: nucleotidyltransferase domain-containing protein [Nitrososphaerota archaeon]